MNLFHLLLVFTGHCYASWVQNDGESVFLETPVLSHLIGTKYDEGDLPIDIATVPLVVAQSSEVCVSSSAGRFDGKVVNVRNVMTWNVADFSRVATCAEKDGAIAVIFTTFLSTPGQGAVTRGAARYKTKAVGIPVLEASERKLCHAERVLGNTTNNINLVITPNRWVDLYEQGWFIALFRVIIPVLAFVAAGNCLRSILRQLVHRKKLVADAKANSTPLRGVNWVSTNTLILMSLFGEFYVTSLIYIYCVLGPLFSTKYLAYESHMMLLTIPLTHTAGLSFSSVALFLRWGTCVKQGWRGIYERLALFAGVIPAAFTYAMQVAWANGSVGPEEYGFANAFAALFASIVSSVIFFGMGGRFTWSIHHRGVLVTAHMITRRRAIVKKFTRWILGVSTAKMMTFLLWMAYAIVNIFVTPTGHALCFAVFFLSSIGQTYAQAYGLSPVGQEGEEDEAQHIESQKAAEVQEERNDLPVETTNTYKPLSL